MSTITECMLSVHLCLLFNGRELVKSKEFRVEEFDERVDWFASQSGVGGWRAWSMMMTRVERVTEQL